MAATDLLCPRYLPIFPSHLQSLGRNAPISAAPNSAPVEVLCRVDVLEHSPPEIDFGSCRARKNSTTKSESSKKLGRVDRLSSALWREDFLLALIHKKNTSKFKWMRVCWNSLGLLSRVVASATFAQSDFG
jgi:hypothetical protein